MDDPHRQWIAEREQLQRLLEPKILKGSAEAASEAVTLFLRQHAAVHRAQVSGAGAPTFADEALQGLTEDDYRRLPAGVEHSAAWLVWHIARCEDITMNLLAAGGPQVLSGGWAEQVRAPAPDTGNSMERAAQEAFNAAVDISALLGYRDAVGRRTREIAAAFTAADLLRKAPAEGIRRAAEEGAVAPADGWLLDYWGGRTTAGLLLMPATRHPLVHLDEITRLKKRLKR